MELDETDLVDVESEPVPVLRDRARVTSSKTASLPLPTLLRFSREGP